MPQPTEIRVLSPADVPRILELAHAAGWNQTPPDLQRMLRFAPEGCFGLWADGQLASTTMAFPYGTEVGWIAMVLTGEADRGKGYATALMRHAIQWLRGRGIAWLKLDASDLGRPIYERLGFQSENRMERRLLAPGANAPSASRGVRDCTVPDLPLALDRAAFGADRASLLELLAEIPGIRIGMLPDKRGYAMLRPGAKALQFGPVVCPDAESARALLSWAIGHQGEQPLQWDFIRENAAALALAEEFGFQPHRLLHRMALAGMEQAPAFAGDNQLVYAIGGFDFG